MFWQKSLTCFWVCIFFVVPITAEKILVVTATPNEAAIAREIGGELIEVEALCKPYENPHFLEVNPTYMVLLHRAQLFVETGLAAEPWVVPLLEGARNPQILPGAAGYVNASVGVTTLEVPASLSRDQGDLHASGNPHYLLDPVNSKHVAYNVYEGLCRISPENKKVFAKNLQVYHQKLRNSLVKWLLQVKPYQGKVKVVSYHRTLPYFTRRFGLQYLNTIEAKPGISPSSAHLESLIAQMKAENCRVILMENWYDRKTADYIASQTGATVLYVPVEVNGKEVKSYLELFDYLLPKILELQK